MKTIFTALLLVVCFCSTAEEVIYDASVKPKVERIYWQPSDIKSAIVYARFEQFDHLRNFVDSTIMAAPAASAQSIDLTKLDKLYLSLQNSDKLIEIFIGPNHFVFNGHNYQVDTEKLTGFIQHNQRRINRGDLVLTKAFSQKLKASGLAI